MGFRPSGWGKVADELNIRMTAFEESVESGFRKVDEAFLQNTKETQLSGRHSDDTGLYRRTSDLYNSFHEITEKQDSLISGNILSDNGIWEKYGEYHQDGTEKLKKRLFIPERFEEWESKYEAVIEDSLAKVAA